MSVILKQKPKPKSIAKLNPHLKKSMSLSKKLGSIEFNDCGTMRGKLLAFNLDFAGTESPETGSNWRLAVYADSGPIKDAWHEHYELTPTQALALKGYISKFLRLAKATAKAGMKSKKIKPSAVKKPIPKKIHVGGGIYGTLFSPTEWIHDNLALMAEGLVEAIHDKDQEAIDDILEAIVRNKKLRKSK